MSRSAARSGRAAAIVSLATLGLLVFGFATGAAARQEPGPSSSIVRDGRNGQTPTTPEEAEVEDRLVAEGRLVYDANCAACHQPDGSGRAGAFPPLLDNPRVDDADYVRDVVRNGLQGEIEVLGETYNGNMPAFSLLDDGQVTALIAYLQEGLGAPVSAPPPIAEPGDTAGTSLPSGAVLTYGIGFAFVLVTVAIVLTPVVLARSDRGTFTPAQTWLKAGVIVVYFILATVVLPSRVVESNLLASPPSVYGDLISDDLWDIIRSIIGSGVWLMALGLGFWGLRRIQRDGVI